jgi:hypothetical protein
LTPKPLEHKVAQINTLEVRRDILSDIQEAINAFALVCSDYVSNLASDSDYQRAFLQMAYEISELLTIQHQFAGQNKYSFDLLKNIDWSAVPGFTIEHLLCLLQNLGEQTVAIIRGANGSEVECKAAEVAEKINAAINYGEGLVAQCTTDGKVDSEPLHFVLKCAPYAIPSSLGIRQFVVSELIRIYQS